MINLKGKDDYIKYNSFNSFDLSKSKFMKIKLMEKLIVSLRNANIYNLEEEKKIEKKG